VTKTQSAGPISCLEHHATRVLHCATATRAAVLMFLLYSRPSSLIRWGHVGWGVPGLVTFTTSGQETEWVYSNPRNPHRLSKITSNYKYCTDLNKTFLAHFRPNRMHEMWLLQTMFPQSWCLSALLADCAKTAQQIEVLIGMDTFVDPRDTVLDGGACIPHQKA